LIPRVAKELEKKRVGFARGRGQDDVARLNFKTASLVVRGDGLSGGDESEGIRFVDPSSGQRS
jgi:hypothetical protein